jgi:hypothetical protein
MTAANPSKNAMSKEIAIIAHDRNETLQKFVSNLRIRDKRCIFTYLERHPTGASCNTFFPQYGIRAGEFAVFHILGDKTQTSRKMKRKQQQQEQQQQHR